MRGVVTLIALVTLYKLVSCCEKETHYQKEEQCCKMCGPGKRMLMNDDCADPRCQDCEDGEYQSGYTSKTKCERQPSCDPNLHFLPQVNPSKTSLSRCQCKPGYFCTRDDDCDTCREHTVCTAGQRVVRKGSAVSDAVCEVCKNGTFSSHDSADACQEWTRCEHGYDKSAPGSSTSDRLCLEAADNNRAVIIGPIMAFLFLLLIVAGAVVYKCTKSDGNWRELPTKAQNMVTGINIVKLDIDPERAEQRLQQPEEDDDSVPVSPTLSNMTENGYPVQQEHGKESVSSHPESNSLL